LVNALLLDSSILGILDDLFHGSFLTIQGEDSLGESDSLTRAVGNLLRNNVDSDSQLTNFLSDFSNDLSDGLNLSNESSLVGDQLLSILVDLFGDFNLVDKLLLV